MIVVNLDHQDGPRIFANANETVRDMLRKVPTGWRIDSNTRSIAANLDGICASLICFTLDEGVVEIPLRKSEEGGG